MRRLSHNLSRAFVTGVLTASLFAAQPLLSASADVHLKGIAFFDVLESGTISSGGAYGSPGAIGLSPLSTMTLQGHVGSVEDVLLSAGENIFDFSSRVGIDGGPNYAINVFLNGNVSAPDISVMAPLGSNDFVANGGARTFSFHYTFEGLKPGANTLTSGAGDDLVTLTNFLVTGSPSIGYTGTFTLQVGPAAPDPNDVPEPGTLALLGGLLLPAAVVLRRRITN